MASPPKLRTRRVDPLHNVIKAISDGDLVSLHSLLKLKDVQELFKKRLMAPRVPKDHSPLVAAILNGDVGMFRSILETFPVNLEQETSAIIEGGYPVEGATPLWTASTLGRIDFVKMLVEKGANIEHTTDSRSSPLRGAAFDGHCEVCEFLIDRGADIDKPNQVGQSPLTIAAAMQKKECVQLLIDKGADVNHKGHNGDMPLHVSVESGAVEITKLLVSAGAKNNPNDVGFTPAILACCYGHKDVMMYLHQTFTLSQKEMYDCYCLLAAKEVLSSNFVQAENYMWLALEIRQKDSNLLAIPSADPIYDGLNEPTTEAELRYILTDEVRMYFLSSIFCERVLGQVHPTTAFYIRISGDMVLADDRYQKCIDLWHRSLDFDAAARMAYELQITEDLLFAIRGFSIMADDKFLPPIEPHFRWGLKEFTMAHESKISEVAVISCLFRMIGVWIKVIECMSDKKQAVEESAKITRAIDDLIKVMEGKPVAVLIACLQNVSEHSSGAGKDVIGLDIPLHKAVALFLDRGCSVFCEDEEGNFPLHLAVKLLDKSAPSCIRTLLEYGAHYDAVNYKKETALTVARACPKPMEGILEELTNAKMHHLSLQCLSARVIVEQGLKYVGILPHRVVEFVTWHQGDCREVSVHELSKNGEKSSQAGSKVEGSVTLVNGSCKVGGATANGIVLTHPQNFKQGTPEH